MFLDYKAYYSGDLCAEFKVDLVPTVDYVFLRVDGVDTVGVFRPHSDRIILCSSSYAKDFVQYDSFSFLQILKYKHISLFILD